ncbi:MAG: hypothetical protein GXN93_05445 [Candidatus Diapherotrites archaeon]|nr:hypothetical protein [Candidatus Diapherotrites archaeon]
MEDLVRFVGRHGDWIYGREIHPPEGLCPYLLRVSAVINERADDLLPQYFDFSGLHSALDDVIASGKPLSKQISSAVRGKAARTAAKAILERIVSEYSLDKKPTAAFKDILKIYSVRYVLRANDHLWELDEDVGALVPPPEQDGYQFIAKHGNWVVVKKQKISPATRPVDIILYFASVSSSVYNGYSAFCDPPVLDIAIDDLLPRSSVSDSDTAVRIYAGFYDLFQRYKFPAHYGPAYDNIKPPKRIRGVKTK